MVAKASAMVPTGPGRPRLRVVKGVTTAEDGADIVKSSPHLWQPLRVDFAAPVEPQPPAGAEVRQIAQFAGLVFLEQLRRLCAAMVRGGVDVPGITADTSEEDMARRIVDAALTQMGLDLDPFVGEPADADDEDEQEPADDGPAGLSPLPGADEAGVEGGDAPRVDPPVNVGPSGDAGPQPPEAEGLPQDDPTETAEGRARVRAWAAEAGVEVSAHGKIPDAVVEQYRDAMAGKRVNRG